jgi:hypothetical protein
MIQSANNYPISTILDVNRRLYKAFWYFDGGFDCSKSVINN